jgi:hypothetical protein
MFVAAAVFPVVIKKFESPDALCKFNNPAGELVPIPTLPALSIVIAVVQVTAEVAVPDGATLNM